MSSILRLWSRRGIFVRTWREGGGRNLSGGLSTDVFADRLCLLMRLGWGEVLVEAS